MLFSFVEFLFHEYILSIQKKTNNYRSAHMDLTCRWCKEELETQDHILKDCPSFTDHTQQIDMNEIMNPCPET